MGDRFEIPGAIAWQNVLRSASSRWSDGRDPGDPESAHARIASGIVLPNVAAKFRLAADDVYFCIGSCFARNIEEQLIYRRLPVLSRSVPFADHTARPNGAVNKYTPASILNELRWSLDGVPFPENPEFVELDYLNANPDVHQAVIDQRFPSGYEHWLAHGRAERRPLRAPQRPLEVERLVGP